MEFGIRGKLNPKYVYWGSFHFSLHMFNMLKRGSLSWFVVDLIWTVEALRDQSQAVYQSNLIANQLIITFCFIVQFCSSNKII